jgi:dTDP-4-amino-4,6-dideoxygalactose transaminase
VQASVHYPSPSHLLPAYRDSRYRNGSLPAAERAALEVLSLPIYPELQREQVEAVCSVIQRVMVPSTDFRAVSG